LGVLFEANISLTLFSKFFEKVMQNKLLKHLSDHNILGKKQNGFRTKLKTDNDKYQLINLLTPEFYI